MERRRGQLFLDGLSTRLYIPESVGVHAQAQEP
jgi:hypothetical protein